MYHAWRRGNASIIEVDDELDIASSPLLASAIEMAVQSGDRFIIVSLERCSFCDSTALGVLVKAKERLGAKFLLVIPPGNRVNRVFDVTGLTTHLTPCADLQEALRSTDELPSAIPLAA